VSARGDAEAPLGDAELSAKFHGLAEPVLGARAAALEQAIKALPDGRSTQRLLDLLLNAV
jgi:hypothetical protein